MVRPRASTLPTGGQEAFFLAIGLAEGLAPASPGSVLQRNGFEAALRRIALRRRRRRVGAPRRFGHAVAAAGVRAPLLRTLVGLAQWLDRVGAHLRRFVTGQHLEFVAYLQVIAIYRADTIHDRDGDLALFAAATDIAVPGRAHVAGAVVELDTPCAGGEGERDEKDEGFAHGELRGSGR